MGEIKYIDFQSWLDNIITQMTIYNNQKIKTTDIKITANSNKIFVKVGENILSTIDLVCE